jgi:transglutaminase-like putative cysteine protease
MSGLQLNSGVRRTLVMLLACALGALPLKAMFTDWGWLLDVYLAMLVVAVPALFIRASGREAGALQIWPGLVLLLFWMTARYVPGHALLGFFPGPGAWRDVGALLDDLHDTTRNSVAPIATTPAVRMALGLMLALLVSLVDLVAVVGRRGALGGLPLLVVFTTAGAVARRSVPWPLFVAAAAGFLLLLGLDARDDLARWGHRVSRRDRRTTGRTLAVSGQRIGAVAIGAALLISLLAPGTGKNMLSDLIRNGVGKGGGSTGTSINPWAGLAGNLRRGQPIDLATVTVELDRKFQPFHLRTQVLDTFTGKGWVSGTPDSAVPLDQLDAELPTVDVPGEQVLAHIKITGMTGAAPVFATTRSVDGLPENFEWDAERATVVGGKVGRQSAYTVTAWQQIPTPSELRDAAVTGTPPLMDRWLDLPDLPVAVSDQVAKLTDGMTNGYDKARAINDFLTNPANGFKYSLTTRAGDSGSDLVDFLKYRQGFCQQYAAAMGVMLRQAGVPARVVLGYAHGVPDKNGRFTITSNDAHAWVEAYFAGIGWVPFDPTPLVGITAGSANDLPWAPHAAPSITSGPDETEPNRPPTIQAPSASATTSQAPTVAKGTGSDGPGWQVASVLLAALAVFGLGAVPWAVRSARTRRRLRDAQLDGPEPLWAELADTATDLGYVWSPSRTPRQVASWLAEPAGDAAAELDRLARAVEVARYARPGTVTLEADERWAELTAVQDALRARAPRKLLWRARLLPDSVLPAWLVRLVPGRGTHR